MYMFKNHNANTMAIGIASSRPAFERKSRLAAASIVTKQLSWMNRLLSSFSL